MAGFKVSEMGSVKGYIGPSGKIIFKKPSKGNLRNIAAYAEKMRTIAPQCAAEARGRPKGSYKSCVRRMMGK